MSDTDRRYLESLVFPNLKENFEIEWKSSLRYDHDSIKPGINKELFKSIHKAICAFANGRRDTGMILVGYHEEKGWLGIEYDGLNKKDGSGNVDEDLWIRTLISSLEDNDAALAVQQIEVKFYSYEEGITCAVIEVSKSPKLIEYGRDKEIFVRAQAKNQKYVGQKNISDWITNRNTGARFRRGWAVDVTDSNMDDSILSFEWQGGSMVREDSSQIPEEPGIYIYTCENPIRECSPFLDSLKSIIYIGSSEKNIRERYDFHFPKPEFRSCRTIYDNYFKFYYWIAKKEDIINIVRWEGELIKYYGPSINKKNEGGR